jgi:hypothetical protein
MCRQITFVERELGCLVDAKYPLMKFNQQLDDLLYFNKQEPKNLPKGRK